MAWVVLLFWNIKGRSRALRIFMAVYMALTAIATLGLGEHYFVDLVAAIPFALFVQAVVWPGDKPALNVRACAIAAGLGLTLVWLLLVRFGVVWMLISPLLPWALVTATAITVWRVKAWSSAVPNSSQPANAGGPPQPLARAAHG
jgi:hypothetical protein